MTEQITSHLLMIRPIAFGFNKETAKDNTFQNDTIAISQTEVPRKASEEFDQFVQVLRDNGVTITVIDDTLQPPTPDSIFPNNWVSFHDEGSTVLYPMLAENRRVERRMDVLEILNREKSKIIDLSRREANQEFLEGTGSMVLDRANRIAYACLSERTNKELLLEWCNHFGFEPCVFNATHIIDGQQKPIYHTNVVMCVGEELAVICTEVIRNSTEREEVLLSLEKSGKRIIEITESQLCQFAGNMLQVKSESDKRLMVMSTQAHDSLNADQLRQIQESNTIVHSSLNTIETLGGGSARCMMAEVF